MLIKELIEAHLGKKLPVNANEILFEICKMAKIPVNDFFLNEKNPFRKKIMKNTEEIQLEYLFLLCKEKNITVFSELVNLEESIIHFQELFLWALKKYNYYLVLFLISLECIDLNAVPIITLETFLTHPALWEAQNQPLRMLTNINDFFSIRKKFEYDRETTPSLTIGLYKLFFCIALLESYKKHKEKKLYGNQIFKAIHLSFVQQRAKFSFLKDNTQEKINIITKLLLHLYQFLPEKIYSSTELNIRLSSIPIKKIKISNKKNSLLSNEECLILQSGNFGKLIKCIQHHLLNTLFPDLFFAQPAKLNPIKNSLIEKENYCILLKKIEHIHEANLLKFVIDNDKFTNNTIINVIEDFDKKEPGSVSGLLKGLNFILKNIDTHFPLDEFVKNLHRHITTGVANLHTTTPGCIRKERVRLSLTKTNTSKNGLLNLRKNINLCGETGAFINVREGYQQKTLFLSSMESLLWIEKLPSEKNWDDQATIASYNPPLPFMLKTLLTTLCSDYEISIASTENNDQKISCIIDFVQSLVQINFFGNSNHKTAYLMLQRLLLENAMLPAILPKPCILEAKDKKTVLIAIKQGQALTESLINKQIISCHPLPKTLDADLREIKITLNDTMLHLSTQDIPEVFEF